MILLYGIFCFQGKVVNLFQDYLAFKAELDRRGNTFAKLDDKVKAGKALKITPEQFKPLEDEWKKVSRQTRLWLWKLDASLPGKLGKFGDWLNQAEEILAQEEEILENPEEMAAQLTNILAEHKVSSKYVCENCSFNQDKSRLVSVLDI